MTRSQYSCFLIILIVAFLSNSCIQFSDKDQGEQLVFTDMHHRNVSIPKYPKRIIAHGSGALRLICYLKATDKIIAIEESERRRNVPYIFANPELRKLPIIGIGNQVDPELINMQNPDLIICTFKSKADIEKLQKQCNTPVIGLNYGDLDTNKTSFYQTLRQLGGILQRQERAEFLINYIDHQLDSLSSIKLADQSLYIGGIAYRGAHGLNSTAPHYLPFKLLSLDNVSKNLAEEIPALLTEMRTLSIDKEQIIEWNPDKIFIDLSGLRIAKQDLNKDSDLGSMLNAVKSKEVYTLLPYIWNATNYEHIITNTIYISKVCSSTDFSEQMISDLANDVYMNFYGKRIYHQMEKLYQSGYKNYLKDE